MKLLFENWRKFLNENSESYQVRVGKDHSAAKKQLIGLGGEKTDAGGGPFKRKPSMKRSKSSPPAGIPIEEGISQVVYHFTNASALANILKTNKIMTSVAYGTDADANINKKKLYYLSLARSMTSTYTKSGRGAAVMKLDGRKLGETYKGAPVDYWGSGWATDEMEDRIFTDKPYIEPADRYIEEISVPMPIWDSGKKYTQTYTTHNIKTAKAIEEEGKKLGIPVYFYYDNANYRMQNKKKALTSVDEWVKMFDKAEGKTTEWDYDTQFSEPFYLVPFIEILEKVYFGDGTKDDLSDKGQKLYDNMRWYEDSIRSIVADIHNNKSDPKARPYIVTIGKAIRKSKHGSFEDLIKAVRAKIREQ